MFNQKQISKTFDELHGEIVSFANKIDEAITKGKKEADQHAVTASVAYTAKAAVEKKVSWLQELRKAFPAKSTESVVVAAPKK